MKCYKCRSIVSEKATFCSNCGYKIGSKEIEEEDFKYLSEKERNELKVLDDPNIEHLVSPFGFIPLIFGSKIGKSNNKKRVVELRTKMRMNKMGLDLKKNKEEYKKIKIEEEKRFDERFK